MLNFKLDDFCQENFPWTRREVVWRQAKTARVILEHSGKVAYADPMKRPRTFPYFAVMVNGDLCPLLENRPNVLRRVTLDEIDTPRISESVLGGSVDARDHTLEDAADMYNFRLRNSNIPVRMKLYIKGIFSCKVPSRNELILALKVANARYSRGGKAAYRIVADIKNKKIDVFNGVAEHFNTVWYMTYDPEAETPVFDYMLSNGKTIRVCIDDIVGPATYNVDKVLGPELSV